MRCSRLACFVVAASTLAGCSSAPGSPEEPVGEAEARIFYGTADTAHTAVVALLNPDQGGYDECSGTIVQVTGGVGFVLTAAHCCNQTQPTIVVMSSDYSGSVSYISSSNPPAPAYAVIAGSVSYDTDYNPNASAPVGDFCMLKFNAPAGTPVIPVALPGQDGLSVGVTVEYVGFGTTQSNTNNSLREHASAPVDQSVTANDFRYTEGGSAHLGGPCEGDSGGPALLPAGAAQSQQRVVGTTSYGDTNCQQYGVSMRVTSATAPGGFIYNYLGLGTSSSSSSSSSSSTSSSGGGACAHALCAAGTALTAACDPCATQLCAADAYCCQTKWDAQCVGEVTSICGQSCSGSSSSSSSSSSTSSSSSGSTTTSSSSSSSSGSTTTSSSSSSSSTSSSSGDPSTSSSSSSGGNTGCGVTSSIPACNDCINASCCVASATCRADPTCLACLGPSAPASCDADSAFTGFASCAQSFCAGPCGIQGDGASSSSSTTSGGGTTSGGAGDTGAGAASAGQSSGCSVAGGGGEPSSPAPLAGLLLGAALARSRRRRA